MNTDIRLRDVLVLLGDPRLPDTYKRNDQFNPEDLQNVEILKRSLAGIEGRDFEYLDDHASLLSRLTGDPPDLLMNLCDTGFRNDALLELHVPALCELLDIPCTGTGPPGTVLSYDKAIVRAVCRDHGLPVPEQVYVAPGESLDEDAVVFPALIKPACADGSLGITRDAVVKDAAQAREYIRWVSRELPGRALLVQEFLSGNEYGIGLIGNPGDGFTALAPLEVDYGRLDPSLPRLLGYESKAEPDSPYWTDVGFRKAETLPDDAIARLVGYSEFIFERFQCRDYGRFDFRTDANGTIKLMEFNSNPAWAHDAKLALMSGFTGLGHGDMLRLIIEATERRVARERAARGVEAR